MPKKKDRPDRPARTAARGVIERAGEVVEQPIVETLEKNYMPYAMSVILSRAIPEIDGFKPSHRKLLFTMYKMGLLGSRAHKERQHRRPDDEAQPARRRRHLRHDGAPFPRL